MLGKKRKLEALDDDSNNDINSKKQKLDDVDHIDKDEEIQSKNEEIKKENFYDSDYFNKYIKTYQQFEKEIEDLKSKKKQYISTLITFIDSLSLIEKYYFLQENKVAIDLYFENSTTSTNKKRFLRSISIYKYLERRDITNPILLSWMNSIRYSKNYERLDYRVESDQSVSVGPFSIGFSYYGDNEGEGNYYVEICGVEKEVEDWDYIDDEDADFLKPLQSFYNEHCNSEELSFSELKKFASLFYNKETWKVDYAPSWDTYSRNENRQNNSKICSEKQKIEASDDDSNSDINSKKQKLDDVDHIDKDEEIQSKNEEIKKENFYDSDYFNKYFEKFNQFEKEIEDIKSKQNQSTSSLISFIDSLSLVEKYYFLQENKEAIDLYFYKSNFTMTKTDFLKAVSLYKYLEKCDVTNPILLSWVDDSFSYSKNYERLDYHVESSTNISVGPFSIGFSYYGDNEGEGNYYVEICGVEKEVEDWDYIDDEDTDFLKGLQSFYNKHCNSEELSFSELKKFTSLVVNKDSWEKKVSWDTYSRNENRQKSARK